MTSSGHRESKGLQARHQCQQLFNFYLGCMSNSKTFPLFLFCKLLSGLSALGLFSSAMCKWCISSCFLRQVSKLHHHPGYYENQSRATLPRVCLSPVLWNALLVEWPCSETDSSPQAPEGHSASPNYIWTRKSLFAASGQQGIPIGLS